ncbi:MAG: hypothetical protein AAGI11_09460 [Pseudomonadota bacterium]
MSERFGKSGLRAHHGASRSPILLATCAVLACLSTACTNQQLYDAIQYANQVDCQNNPEFSYERCMRQVSQPYSEYESDRLSLLEESP